MHVPTGTSIRFAVLVITMIVSTGSIFGYFWQISEPRAQATVHQCISPRPFGSLGSFVNGLSEENAARSFLVAACLRSAAPSLAIWFLIGVALLMVFTVLLYRITPWWMINVGRPYRPRRLTQLDLSEYPQIARVASIVELPDKPTYLLDNDPALLQYRHARAFGYQRRTFVQLSTTLLVASDTDPARFADILLHELAHLQNQDIPSTYLTLAARRAFAVLIPAGYLAALLVAGGRAALPDPRTVIALVALVVLVELSARSVLRAREHYADATADALRQRESAPLRDDDDAAAADSRLPRAQPETSDPAASQQPSNRPGAFRRNLARVLHGAGHLLDYHPPWLDRGEALRQPELLYRSDAFAMFGAGIAIGLLVSELNSEVFAASLPMLFGPDSPLASGLHALGWVLLTFGPAALLAAGLIAWLACDATARLHYRFLVRGDPVPAMRTAVPMAAGMLVAEPLSFSNVLAGTWGFIDTSAVRQLAVAALSAAVLTVVLTATFRWASESTAAWFDGAAGSSRVPRAAAKVVCAVGLTPALCAWNVNHDTPVSLQVLWGPDRGEQPLIGHWPAVGALFAHFQALGTLDIIPGNALLLLLPCVFVAAAALYRPVRATRAAWLPGGAADQPSVPVKTAITVGLAGAGISLFIILDLMLSLHTVIGGPSVSRAGGYGLIYLTRVAETVVAICAGAAAASVAGKANGTRLTSGILTALITATAAAVFVPYLLYIGFLGWPHPPTNPLDARVLFGIVATLGPGRAIVSALVFMALRGLLSQAVALARRTRVTIPTGPTRVGRMSYPGGALARVSDASVLLLLIATLGIAMYDFLSFGLSYV